MMEESNGRHIPWTLFVSELIGTALLVLVGLSLVILMFGTDTPMARLIPSEGLRRLITGFFFGTTGACIALSPVGKVSGAHINPAVTLAFRLMGKLDLRTTLGYIGAQLIGAVVGSLPLLLWGAMGKSVAFGATLPGPGCHSLDGVPGRSDHDIYDGHSACRLSGFPDNSSLHSGDLPTPLCDHGMGRGAHLRHKHKSSTQPWPSDHIRAMAGLVDLLGRTDGWNAFGHTRL